MELKVKLIDKNKKYLPKKSTDGAGGWDVRVRKIVKLGDGRYICHLGFKLAPRKDYKINLRPRSSITSTNLIMQNSPGLGDSDYRGEYLIIFKTLPSFKKTWWGGSKVYYEDFPYKVGDRIGQLELQRVTKIEFKICDKLPEAASRIGGFGSTGNK